MLVKEDGRCFVCGPDNPSGLHGVFESGSGRAVCRLSIAERFQGWEGVVHGGVVAALLDEACIYACRRPGEQMVTAELNVRFRRPVPVGREVTVTAEMTEERRRVRSVKARLEIGGEIHAEAEAKVFLTS